MFDCCLSPLLRLQPLQYPDCHQDVRIHLIQLRFRSVYKIVQRCPEFSGQHLQDRQAHSPAVVLIEGNHRLVIHPDPESQFLLGPSFLQPQCPDPSSHGTCTDLCDLLIHSRTFPVPSRTEAFRKRMRECQRARFSPKNGKKEPAKRICIKPKDVRNISSGQLPFCRLLFTFLSPMAGTSLPALKPGHIHAPDRIVQLKITGYFEPLIRSSRATVPKFREPWFRGQRAISYNGFMHRSLM